MKLRQKMAMLLAAAMVFSAVPMMTMANSDATPTNGIIVRQDDSSVVDGKQLNMVYPGDSKLRIELKTAHTNSTTPAMFFVNVDNAKWQYADTTTVLKAGGVRNGVYPDFIVPNGVTDLSVKKNSDSELQITMVTDTQANLTANDDAKMMFIPLWTELKTGDAKVSILSAGSVVSDYAPVIYARTQDKKATVTFGDAKAINKSGKIADITIEEPVAGVISTDDEIKVSLRNTNYKFKEPVLANFELTKGFSGASVTGFKLDANKDLVFYITKSSTLANVAGRIKIKDLEVSYDKSGTSLGDKIEVKVEDSKDQIIDTNGLVAESKEIGNYIEMKDKKVVDVVAGHSKKITFTVKENVDDSTLEDRNIEVRLDKGYFADQTSTGSTQLANEKTSLINAIKVKDRSNYTVDSFDWIWDNDKDDHKAIGFSFKIKPNAGQENKILKKDDKEDIEFKDVEVFMPLDKTGDATLSIEGRGLGSTAKVVAMNAIAPITVTTEAATLKVGLKEQKAGKIVIKETDKDRLEQGKFLKLWIDDAAAGFQFKNDDSVKDALKVTEGDLQFDLDNVKVSSDKKSVTLKVKRSSSTASTITFDGLIFNVDRTVPQGKYDLKVAGTALNREVNEFGDLSAKDFIVIATPNTEDITDNGLKKATASFTVGASKFVVNGVESTMDGAAYVVNGRTMVPVRYVANALGVDGKNIYSAGKAVTIIAGERTITLEVGSKVAKLNGAPARTMAVAPVVKAGRTYVPVSELGAILGVEATWDAATQTASFVNK